MNWIKRVIRNYQQNREIKRICGLSEGELRAEFKSQGYDLDTEVKKFKDVVKNAKAKHRESKGYQ